MSRNGTPWGGDGVHRGLVSTVGLSGQSRRRRGIRSLIAYTELTPVVSGGVDPSWML